MNRRAKPDEAGARQKADLARLDAYIARIIDSGPVLTVEQTRRMRRLLAPVLRPDWRVG